MTLPLANWTVFRNTSPGSLMSPLSHSMSIEEGQRLTDDCARMILSLPVTNPDVPHAGRRALLFGRRSGENA